MFKRMAAAAAALALGVHTNATQAEVVSLPIDSSLSVVTLQLTGSVLGTPLNFSTNLNISGVVTGNVVRTAGTPTSFQFFTGSTVQLPDLNNVSVDLGGGNFLFVDLTGSQFIFVKENPNNTFVDPNDPVALTPNGFTPGPFPEPIYQGSLANQGILLNGGVAKVTAAGFIANLLAALGPTLNDPPPAPPIYFAADNSIRYNFGTNPTDATLPADAGNFDLVDGMTQVDRATVNINATIPNLINEAGIATVNLILTGQIVAVPEVGSMVMMAVGSGLIGLVGFRRYRRSA